MFHFGQSIADKLGIHLYIFSYEFMTIVLCLEENNSSLKRSLKQRGIDINKPTVRAGSY